MTHSAAADLSAIRSPLGWFMDIQDLPLGGGYSTTP